MNDFAARVREIAERFPESRSAIIPALRLAQEENGGWLSTQSFERVGAALGVTPGYCPAGAALYDMLHLEPVGRHLVEVCTNLSCALAGAQQVVDVFESELGVAPGETTADGEVTLRTAECLGGCGYATVVAVDNRYRQDVKPEDVPAIVEELRAG
jgi:NADH-quinone oxidoreductase subunit E